MRPALQPSTAAVRMPGTPSPPCRVPGMGGRPSPPTGAPRRWAAGSYGGTSLTCAPLCTLTGSIALDSLSRLAVAWQHAALPSTLHTEGPTLISRSALPDRLPDASKTDACSLLRPGSAARAPGVSASAWASDTSTPAPGPICTAVGTPACPLWPRGCRVTCTGQLGGASQVQQLRMLCLSPPLSSPQHARARDAVWFLLHCSASRGSQPESIKARPDPSGARASPAGTTVPAPPGLHPLAPPLARWHHRACGAPATGHSDTPARA
eukprot:jgi/Ulvmu1/10290/UM060_0092.1